tara:strand:- start:57 stop:278 length:222 start_codon:yes stop_codon:yes gene_type:complete
MKNKQELINRVVDFYLTGHNLKENEAKAVISLIDEYKAINYTRCCTEFFCNNQRIGIRCVKQCLGCDQFENKE